MSVLQNQISPLGMTSQGGFPGRDTVPTFKASGALTVTQTSLTVTYGVGVLGLVLQASQTSGFTAIAGNIYPVDSTGGGFNITMPATASVGDTIWFIKFGTNAVTWLLNGLKFYGSTVNPVASSEGIEIMQYTGATRGWVDQ